MLVFKSAQMKYKQMLAGENLYLSPVSSEDNDIYCTWLSNPRISVHTRAFGVLYTQEFEKKHLENITSGTQSNARMMAVVQKRDNSLIGSGGFFDIDFLNRRAEMGIIIGDERLHGKGYGTEATNLLLEYAFTMLNLNAVFLNFYSFNKKGKKVYEKCGFKYAGTMREARIIGNRKFDMITMDILASEFNSNFLEKIIDK